MQNFYFRSVMLVFIMVGMFSIMGCSMYPAITPVAQVHQVVEDEHNIATYEVEQGETVSLEMEELNGHVEDGNQITEVTDTNVTNETTPVHTDQTDSQLEVDFESQPIEDIVEQNEEQTEEQVQAEDSAAQQNAETNEVNATEVKTIALTFDDGPDLKYTPQVLDILQEKNIKATFFIVGIQIKKFPEVVQRMVDEGHLIANHTYHHPNLKSLTKEEILVELDTTDDLIESIVGFRPTIMRPPYGAINDDIRQIIHDSGREVVLWNIDPRDWASTPVDEMYENVMTNARNEGNILFHSFGGKQIQNTVDLLPSVIDALTAEGYTFVTVEQLP